MNPQWNNKKMQITENNQAKGHSGGKGLLCDIAPAWAISSEQ